MLYLEKIYSYKAGMARHPLLIFYNLIFLPFHRGRRQPATADLITGADIVMQPLLLAAGAA